MSVTVFYSWQSDSDETVNRNFLQDALKRAIRNLRRSVSLEEALRDVALDSGTAGVAGTPPIADTIFGKIDSCQVFAPDVTFVGITPAGRKIPNPNVLIEYGWALKAAGHPRMLPVMNTAYGSPDSHPLPFDMRHLRNPVMYHLPPDSPQEDRRRVRELLVKELTRAIELILTNVAMEDERTAYEPISSTTTPSTFFGPDEHLIVPQRMRRGLDGSARLPDGPRLFLRLIPTRSISIRSSKAASELVSSHNLRPMMGPETTRWFPYRNTHGAFVCSETDGSIDALTQLFMSGELWGVDCCTANQNAYLGPNRSTFQYFPCADIEDVFSNTLAAYLTFAKEALNLPIPLRVLVGATDVRGHRMSAPRGLKIGYEQYGGQVVEQHLIYPEIVLDSYDIAARQMLRPFFEYIWEECDLKRPDRERL